MMAELQPSFFLIQQDKSGTVNSHSKLPSDIDTNALRIVGVQRFAFTEHVVLILIGMACLQT